MEMNNSISRFRQAVGGVREKCVDLTCKTRQFWNKLNVHSLLALAGIIGPLSFVIGDLVAALSDKDYDLWKNSISSLALTSIGWAQTIGFLLLGLFIEIFTTGFMFNVKRYKWFLLGIAFFVFFGFCMLLIGAFHTDPVGIVKTVEGRIHGYIATATFGLFPVAVLCFMPSLKRDNRWKDLYKYTRITCILGVLLLVMTRIFQETSGWFGLAERLLVWNMILWVEISAVRLFILSLKRPVTPRPVAIPEIDVSPQAETDQ
jgi:hypothetical protein